MKSITELEKEQREALYYWIEDMRGDNPIIIRDPHNYLTETEDLIMEISKKTEKGAIEWLTYQSRKI